MGIFDKRDLVWTLVENPIRILALLDILFSLGDFLILGLCHCSTVGIVVFLKRVQEL